MQEATDEAVYVERSENDQLVVTDSNDVESLTENVANGEREAVENYLHRHVDANSVMVKHVSIDTDFQTGRRAVISYDVLDDLRQLEFEGIHD